MKSTTIRKAVIGMARLAAATIQPKYSGSPRITLADSVRAARAAEGSRVIEIKAKKFEFSPSEVKLKKGEPVILRLSSEERTHGFFLKPLGIDTDIIPDKNTDLAVTPEVPGDYTVICDHYCGSGHSSMKMKLTVVE